MKIRNGILAFTVVSASFIHPAAHAALHTWSGGGPNPGWTNAANWGGTAPVAGDDLLFPPTAAQMNSSNNFPSGTTFNSLIFSGGGYTLVGNSIALNAGIRATNGIDNLIINSLILNSNQTFTINIGSGNLYLEGDLINLNGKDLTFDVGSSSVAQVPLVISGAGGLIKTGPGGAVLYASNTFSGSVQILQVM
jgi:autotransporter-associated beta strand protein